MMRFIFAADKKSYGIGYQNQLAWHLPEDLQFLRETIKDSPIIAGSTTYLSLPSSLQKRTLVLSGKSPETSWSNYLNKNHQNWWVLGGKSVYESLLQRKILPHVSGGVAVWINFKKNTPQYDCYLTEFCQALPVYFNCVDVKTITDNDHYHIDAVFLENKKYG